MIKNLTEGTTIHEQVFIKKAEEKLGKRGPYTCVTFTDGETDAIANVWLPISSFPYQGKVVDAEITMRNGFVNILSASCVTGADLSKYVSHAPIDEEKCFQMICNAIQGIKNPDIRMLADYIINRNASEFRRWSAAKSAHHNYLNGLMYHVCRMLANVKTVSTVYGLDEDMLTAGVILHDIGKLAELDTDDMGTSEFTRDGFLFGHLYLGAEMINNACTKLGIDSNTESIALLKHMILSHHDLPEYGAVKMPATKEAYALTILDLLDSKLWMYEKEYMQIPESSFSNAVRLLDGRHVYHPAV